MKTIWLLNLLLLLTIIPHIILPEDNKHLYFDLFKDKNILVTGGTGTLGKALVYEMLKYQPKQIIIFSRDETKQFYLAQDLNYNQKVKFILGDIRNYDSLVQATKGVHIVFHTAALKRVESVESNVEEAIKTNVLGSTNVFKACVANNVDKVIYVSTDKSCSPINAYGASKFLAEKIFNNYDRTNIHTVFSTVRFGNIVGSTGSILSIFSEKIKKGDDIPLTDPRMTRFIISSEEAVTTIFDALMYGRGGEIFIKKLPAIKIVDFITTLKDLLHSECNIVTIGRRPGERLYESLLTEGEVFRAFEFNNYYVLIPSLSDWMESFNQDDLPIYISQGVPLKKIISKEFISDDFLITKDEFAHIFEKTYADIIK